LDEARVKAAQSKMAEPPHLREQRLIDKYKISRAAAEVIVSERELADLYEEVARKVDPKLTAAWFRTKLKKVLNYMKLKAAEIKFTPTQFAELIRMVKTKRVTPEQGELVLRELAKNPADPEELLLKLGLVPLKKSELRSAVTKAIRENPKAVKDYCSGKKEAINFLVGKVIELTKGRANPREVTRSLLAEIKKK